MVDQTIDKFILDIQVALKEGDVRRVKELAAAYERLAAAIASNQRPINEIDYNRLKDVEKQLPLTQGTSLREMERRPSSKAVSSKYPDARRIQYPKFQKISRAELEALGMGMTPAEYLLWRRRRFVRDSTKYGELPPGYEKKPRMSGGNLPPARGAYSRANERAERGAWSSVVDTRSTLRDAIQDERDHAEDELDDLGDLEQSERDIIEEEDDIIDMRDQRTDDIIKMRDATAFNSQLAQNVVPYARKLAETTARVARFEKSRGMHKLPSGSKYNTIFSGMFNTITMIGQELGDKVAMSVAFMAEAATNPAALAALRKTEQVAIDRAIRGAETSAIAAATRNIEAGEAAVAKAMPDIISARFVWLNNTFDEVAKAQADLAKKAAARGPETLTATVTPKVKSKKAELAKYIRGAKARGLTKSPLTDKEIENARQHALAMGTRFGDKQLQDMIKAAELRDYNPEIERMGGGTGEYPIARRTWRQREQIVATPPPPSLPNRLKAALGRIGGRIKGRIYPEVASQLATVKAEVLLHPPTTPGYEEKNAALREQMTQAAKKGTGLKSLHFKKVYKETGEEDFGKQQMVATYQVRRKHAEALEKSILRVKEALSGQNRMMVQTITLDEKQNRGLTISERVAQSLHSTGQKTRRVAWAFTWMSMSMLGVFFSLNSLLNMAMKGFDAMLKPLSDLENYFTSLAMAKAFGPLGDQLGKMNDQVIQAWKNLQGWFGTFSTMMAELGAKIFTDPKVVDAINKMFGELYKIITDPNFIESMKGLVIAIADAAPALLPLVKNVADLVKLLGDTGLLKWLLLLWVGSIVIMPVLSDLAAIILIVGQVATFASSAMAWWAGTNAAAAYSLGGGGLAGAAYVVLTYLTAIVAIVLVIMEVFGAWKYVVAGLTTYVTAFVKTMITMAQTLDRMFYGNANAAYFEVMLNNIDNYTRKYNEGLMDTRGGLGEVINYSGILGGWQLPTLSDIMGGNNGMPKPETGEAPTGGASAPNPNDAKTLQDAIDKANRNIVVNNTINLPENATNADVQRALIKAVQNGSVAGARGI